MKIISNAVTLNKEFSRLLKKYSHYCWAVAWAGTPTNIFDELKVNNKKIEKFIIGLHFYQTHPQFIKTFSKNENVKYIKLTNGTYHPKVYLFYNSEKEWEILSGSYNFTAEAFSNNLEFGILFSNTDGNQKLFDETMDFINNYWKEGSQFSEEELIKYQEKWHKHKDTKANLSDNLGNKFELLTEPKSAGHGSTLQQYLKQFRNNEFKSIWLKPGNEARNAAKILRNLGIKGKIWKDSIKIGNKTYIAGDYVYMMWGSTKDFGLRISKIKILSIINGQVKFKHLDENVNDKPEILTSIRWLKSYLNT
jgi:hypothetical protein